MANRKNILLTGGTGAVGLEVLKQLHGSNRLDGVSVLVRDSKHTRKVLKPFGSKIKIFYGDITKPDTLIEACKNQDYCIHLAAIIPPLSEDNKPLGRNVNTEGTRNVVQALENNSPNAFLLYSSSIVVYGDRLKTPEIRTTDSLETEHNDNYGLSKIDAEAIIRDSKLKWSIFRLTAIMGIGNHKVSGIMFDVPLETKMEIATVRDTARAFINSIDHSAELKARTFNLGGGENCRLTYLDFLTRAFRAFGMGKINFPDFAFARQNFHCGHYMDGDDLEAIIQFRSDNIESYFKRFDASIPKIQRIFTLPFCGIIKYFLLKLSVPYKAYKTGDKEKINFFFGNIEQ